MATVRRLAKSAPEAVGYVDGRSAGEIGDTLSTTAGSYTSPSMTRAARARAHPVRSLHANVTV